MARDDWKTFAVQLFRREDADPGYMCLARADLPQDQKMRFMAAWCTYYNLGIAAQASEYRKYYFWDYLIAQYPIAKRASERRHFRGNAGMKALLEWRSRFPMPEQLVQHMAGPDYFQVRKNAEDIPQIGPYFVWKFADVQERVFRIPCDFSGSEKYSPKVPREGAQLIFHGASTEWAYKQICIELNASGIRGAPPWYDRPFDIQEAETVCCVYHQYIGGKYWYGNRTAKAIVRLNAVPCLTSWDLIKAFRMTQKTILERVKWAQTITERLA